jgi:high-affinity Fe2+/Pb2+ permease
MQEIVAERAERLSKHRAIAAIVMGTVLAATQTQRMDASGAGPITWIITGVVVAIFLLWASGLFRDTALRGILNDEGSDVSRRRSLMIGFWNMLATAVVCYVLTYVKDYGPRDAIQIIMSVGICSALISFGVAERVSARQ